MIYRVEIERKQINDWVDDRYHWGVYVENGKYNDGEDKWSYIRGGYTWRSMKRAKRRALKIILNHDKQKKEIGIVMDIKGTPEELKDFLKGKK